MADSSNTEVDSQVDESTESETTSNSNEDLSGGFDSSALSDESLSVDSTPDFGIDFGSNNNSDSFDFSYNPFDDSGSDFGDALFGDSGSSETSEDDSKSEPTMTVDEVYGKGNQSIVEDQGDYAASSNEKSNVETSTLGKQDEISVTPTSVAENKGLVNNNTIQSVEGLDFQQKDKESQDVLEAKKNRDEVESKDKANQMRDSLKANQESLKAKTDLTEEEKNAINKFQIGNDDIEKLYAKAFDNKAQDLQSKSDVLTQRTKEAKDATAAAEEAEARAKKADKAVEEAQILENRTKQLADRFEEKKAETTLKKGDSLLDGLKKAGKLAVSPFANDKELQELEKEVKDLAKALGTDAADILDVKRVGDFVPGGKESFLRDVQKDLANTAAEKVAAEKDNQQKAQETAKSARAHATELTTKVKEAQVNYDKAQKDYDNLKASKESFRNSINSIKSAYENGEIDANKAVAMLQEMTLMADYSPLGIKTADMVYLAGGLDGKYLASNPSALQASYVGAEKAPEVAPKTNAVTPEAKTKATENTPSKAEASIQAAREALKSSDLSPEQQAQAEQMLSDIEASRQAVIEASSKLANNLEEVNPADIKTFIDKTDQYHKILEDDLKGNPFTKTDFNRTFTKAIVDAIDLGEIILADGTKTTYSQLSTDMATKSPEVAKAMYEAKADRLEKDGHNILAKIERAKAAMVGNWFGSKLTLADNQVRNQFNQMAKTNMRATYATYNNVLKDTTGKYSEAEKAEASAAIKQANALMTASAALQASTGFWSGIGDSMKDGVYGTTNPKDLNAYQKTLNAVDNLAKITLGLGVTPAANKAYQNMYYMAGAKVNESGLYSKDWDGDGFALCQEYGNNAAAGMIAGAGELATGVVLVFNPSTVANGIDLIVDSIKTFTDGLYGVQKEARKSEEYTKDVLEYFEEAKDIVAETGNKEAADTIDNAITRIENFELKSDEVGNLNNWLEGSGSNTADNGKFNQALTYDEWLKLIEADPTMRDYAKKLIAEKKSE